MHELMLALSMARQSLADAAECADEMDLGPMEISLHKMASAVEYILDDCDDLLTSE